MIARLNVMVLVHYINVMPTSLLSFRSIMKLNGIIQCAMYAYNAVHKFMSA